MIRGLYTSVAGLTAADARHQLLAYNLVNANTPGYKADDLGIESFEQVLAALADPATPGTGARSGQRRIDLSQGGLTQTGEALDLALDGPGFFVLTGPDGTPRYTRAGRFHRDMDGVLRNADGLPVQDENGQPLTATGAEVRVLADGTVLSDGAPAGRLRLVAVDPTTLARAGTVLFTSTDANPQPAAARVVSGALENANVDPTNTMTAMLMLLRAFEADRQALQLQNETLAATVNQVGTVR
jgi:flagellar basal-body rod protein FlgF